MSTRLLQKSLRLPLSLTVLLVGVAALGCSRQGQATAPAAVPASTAQAPAPGAPGAPGADDKVVRDIQSNPTLSENTKKLYIDALKQSSSSAPAGTAVARP